MDIKRVLKLYGSALLVMVLTAGLTACKDGDDEDEIQLSFQYLERSFRGVWTVDDVKTDTTDVWIEIDNNRGNKNYKNYVAYWGFPYKAIISNIYPDIKISQILHWKNMYPDAGIANQLFDFMIKTISKRGGNSRIDEGNNPIVSIMINTSLNSYRNVGVSGSTLYFELRPPYETVPVLFLPFIVITDRDETIGVIATVSYSNSTAILDIIRDTFSSTITLSQVEIIQDGDMQTKTLSPEMRLKYTSFQTIESPTVGN